MTDSQVLKRLDSPAYCVRVLDNNLIAVSGGGGTAKTGVGNSIELGIVDYETASSSRAAQFQTIHKYEPNDAVMKFITFSHDRSKRLSKAKTPKNGYASKPIQSTSTTQPLKADYDSTKNDLFIAAALNDTIEIYKVQPTIDKLNKTNTNSNNNLRQRNGSVRRSNSNSSQSLKPNGINHQSHSSVKYFKINKKLLKLNFNFNLDF